MDDHCHLLTARRILRIGGLSALRALAIETRENWLKGTRYLNVDHLANTKGRRYGARHDDGPNLPARDAMLAAVNRDRGAPRDAAPPTPPGIRVRRIKHWPAFPWKADPGDGNEL